MVWLVVESVTVRNQDETTPNLSLSFPKRIPYRSSMSHECYEIDEVRRYGILCHIVVSRVCLSSLFAPQGMGEGTGDETHERYDEKIDDLVLVCYVHGQYFHENYQIVYNHMIQDIFYKKYHKGKGK